jgi:hypothetical protein
MKFNYYAQDGKAFIRLKEMEEKYKVPYTTLLFHLNKNESIPILFIGKTTFYKMKEATDYLNKELNVELSWDNK